MTGTSVLPVVVGVDGSTSARLAADWAADEAARRDATLRVVHAYLWNIVHAPAGRHLAGYRRPMLDAAKRMLDNVALAATRRHPELTVTSQLVEVPAVELMLAESRHAGLVVLGSRGLGGFTGLLVGSVAVAVASHGGSPLVVVRGRRPDTPPPADGPVVVGVSGSAHDTAAIRFAFQAASRLGAGLIAVHAWSDIPLAGLGGEWRPALDWAVVSQAEQRLLADQLAGWQQEFPDVEVERSVTTDRPVRSLLHAAEAAQLLVVGCRGRGGFTGMLLGSVSQALLHHSPCPIAVVRDKPGS